MPTTPLEVGEALIASGVGLGEPVANPGVAECTGLGEAGRLAAVAAREGLRRGVAVLVAIRGATVLVEVVLVELWAVRAAVVAVARVVVAARAEVVDGDVVAGRGGVQLGVTLFPKVQARTDPGVGASEAAPTGAYVHEEPLQNQ